MKAKLSFYNDAIWFLLLFVILASAQNASSQTKCTDLFKNNRLVFNQKNQIENIEDLQLSTNRLELRPLSAKDHKLVDPIWNNPESQQMTQHSTEKSEILKILNWGQQKFSRFKNHKSPLVNFGIYKDGELIGTLWLAGGFELPIYKSRKGDPDQKWLSMGYHLKPSAWKQGIATEAAARVIQFAFESLNTDGMHIYAIPSNVGSHNVIRKLGFKDLDYIGGKFQHYYLTREIYQNN